MSKVGALARLLPAVALSSLPRSAAAATCGDDNSAPYAAEASPFGWPITPHFSWDKQECWAHKWPFCGGGAQSPMNIEVGPDSSCASTMVGSMGALKDRATYGGDKDLASTDWVLKGFPSNPRVKVSKYMRTITAEGPFGTLRLKDSTGHTVEYEATEVHLTFQSLHMFDGKRRDAEMLVMHRPKGATDMVGGGVVVSVLFDAHSAGSPIFDKMIPPTAEGAEWTVDRFGLAETLLPALEGPSYQYNGSVPVPPCSETVTWFVLGETSRVSAAQLDRMKKLLLQHAGGWEKRAPVERRLSEGRGACRPLMANSIEVETNHEKATCDSASADKLLPKLPACTPETQKCRISPEILAQPAQTGTPVVMISMAHYAPTEHVTMAPSDMSLDGTVAHGGDFGHLLINGRHFRATKLQVKAVSSHTVHGQRYVGELLVQHELYGSSAAGAGAAHGAAPHSATSHRRLQVDGGLQNRVVVSVPLKLGKESPLLRHLRLGQPAVQEAIRDGNSYQVHEPIDLSMELKAAMAGPWYWYRTAEDAHTCGNAHLKWLVFATPLEVSLEQLNDLALRVSGFDATGVQPSEAVPVWKESFPAHAVEPVAGSHGECGQPWSYKSHHCWAKNFSACGGKRQSPINLKSADVGPVGTDNFLAHCSWQPVRGLEVNNSGRGLQVTNNQLGYFSFISQEGNQEYYQVTGMKLHMPSEHHIDSRPFAAELQIVHQRQKAVNHFDEEDVAITSFMFDVGANDSPLLKQLHLPGHAVQEGAPVKTQLPIDLMRALGPALEGSYYRYDGSLTVPDCSEHTKWFVFDTPMEMSQAQLSAFQAQFPGAGNNRPLQDINGRIVAKNSFMQGTLKQYEFYLNRKGGRSRSDWNRSTTLILIPIICTVLFTIVIMASLFVREDKRRRGESAGGLSGGPEQGEAVGRPGPYARF